MIVPPLRLSPRRVLAVAAIAIAGGIVACVGAAGPWVAVSIFTLRLSVAGTTSQLDGAPARALGIAGVVLGALLALSRGRLRLAGLAWLLGVAVAGCAVIAHEGYHLSTVDSWLRGIPHLEAFAHSLGIGAHAAWGFYACGAGFVVMLAAAVAGLVGERQSRRKAPPSTGITHPVRYDAAGESTNAAT